MGKSQGSTFTSIAHSMLTAVCFSDGKQGSVPLNELKTWR
jgi:hypothetical protein